jgi:hypothetical protein
MPVGFVRHQSLTLLIVSLFFLGACGRSENNDVQAQRLASQSTLKNPEKIYATVLEESTELQGKLVDGWFRSEDWRSLKSGYAQSAPAIKAQFACDYARMLNASGQDMVHNWSSYVPYSKRSEFARRWWSDPKHSIEFNKKDRWAQIIWLHEALMDASELWWRAFEKSFPEGIESPATLAHDCEQDMVAKFKENENSPARSFSAMDK